MNETEVRDLLARAAASPAPDRIDVDSAIASGVRRRRQRVAAALGSVVVALAVVVGVLLVGLPRFGASPSPVASSSTPPLAGTRWVLTSYADSSGAQVEPQPADLPRASLWFLSGSQLTGSTGCNGFGGDYVVQGSSLTIPEPGHTQMYCSETAAQEESVLHDLGRVASYAVVSGSLHLLDASGSVVLAYAPQDLELAGTSWRVSGISGDRGDGTSVSASATSRMTLDFRADGTFTGSDSCNQFGGTWESTRPGRVYLTGFGGTEVGCTDMASPARYLALLARVTTYTIDWDRLTLSQEGRMGTITLQRVAASAPGPGAS